jgi:sugar-specific transcriptional regulator TrmB
MNHICLSAPIIKNDHINKSHIIHSLKFIIVGLLLAYIIINKFFNENNITLNNEHSFINLTFYHQNRAERIITNEIDSAKDEIYISDYVVSFQGIEPRILNAYKRGVRIYLLTEGNIRSKTIPTSLNLRNIMFKKCFVNPQIAKSIYFIKDQSIIITTKFCITLFNETLTGKDHITVIKDARIAELEIKGLKEFDNL